MTRRLLVPTFGPSDWRRFLADPGTQWRATKSAYELAVSWEAARNTTSGLPPGVADIFATAASFEDAKLLLGVPEHQVPLAGGRRASQTDLWALLATSGGVVSVAVEGKAGESFDKLVPDWLKDAAPRSGKPARLEQLCRILGISTEAAHGCRYQLLHRTAVAVIEARRFNLRRAVFLVQSFKTDPESFADYVRFADYLGVSAAKGLLQSAGQRDGIELWIGWIDCPVADAAVLAAAV